jgi:hypothetical protein
MRSLWEVRTTGEFVDERGERTDVTKKQRAGRRGGGGVVGGRERRIRVEEGHQGGGGRGLTRAEQEGEREVCEKDIGATAG